ncbi:TPA: beta-lactamase [Enterobacter kobei]|nr:beta-lactamase [Enterobacter kobei]HDT4959013.1 beta-lactamase [Enterobacter kobei]
MKKNTLAVLMLVLIPLGVSANNVKHPLLDKFISDIVNQTIEPLIKQQDIPGMAVGLIYQGEAWIFNYGLADIKNQRVVNSNTLFELGSVSKTFTGLAGSYAAETGKISLNDAVQKYWTELPDDPWKGISMLNLATYTAGGLPLQFPDAVINLQTLKSYYSQWQPVYQPGTMRQYSNPSIGLFGMLSVKNSGLSFDEYMARNILTPLNLRQTYITVPPNAENDYAWGYKNGKALRVTPGMLDAEAYGVKSSISDMVRFTQVNMEPASYVASPLLKQAIHNAQKRYFLTEGMYQGLGWEIYSWPVDQQKIITASGNASALKARSTQQLSPPQPATTASFVHKTGATNGFGAYVAFIPEKRVGIVMLANKNYPNPARVTAAFTIINALLAHESH